MAAKTETEVALLRQAHESCNEETGERLEDHEIRIRFLEMSHWKQTRVVAGWSAGAAGTAVALAELVKTLFLGGG